MDLKSYREIRGWSREELAAKLDVANESVIRRYEAGQRLPRPETVERIERLTEGEVRYHDLYATHKAFKDRQPGAEAHAA